MVKLSACASTFLLLLLLRLVSWLVGWSVAVAVVAVSASEATLLRRRCCRQSCCCSLSSPLVPVKKGVMSVMSKLDFTDMVPFSSARAIVASKRRLNCVVKAGPRQG
jgi:hypothetical protein